MRVAECSEIPMKNVTFSCILVTIVLIGILAPAGAMGGPLQKCTVSGFPSGCSSVPAAGRGPTCGIELTCIDKPVQLGYSEGVCFRATCPGIWALLHKRADQASFRRRYFAYRHYAFHGTWVLKNQGVIESGPAAFRELFLVLPEDLIEFKLRDSDANAAIEITNLGYIKRGTVEDLKKWLAYNTYLERPIFRNAESQSGRPLRAERGYPGSSAGCLDMIMNPLNCLVRVIGLPWF